MVPRDTTIEPACGTASGQANGASRTKLVDVYKDRLAGKTDWGPSARPSESAAPPSLKRCTLRDGKLIHHRHAGGGEFLRVFDSGNRTPAGHKQMAKWKPSQLNDSTVAGGG